MSLLFLTVLTYVQMLGCTQWDILTKYVLVDENSPYNWIDAENECNALLNTSLASVHSENDNTEVVSLCRSLNITYPLCWIGLYDDSMGVKDFTLNVWKWSDGTTFEYGNESAGSGIHPWFTNNPDNENGLEHCVELRATINYKWNDAFCGVLAFSAICNMPSELCYHSNWTQIIGDWQWNGLCNLININNGDISTIKLTTISTKLWTKIIVEYTFSISNPINKNTNVTSGLLLNYFDTESNGIYIGFKYNIISLQMTLFILHNSVYISDLIINNIKFDIFYVLKVKLDGHGRCFVYVNDVEFLNVNIIDALNYYINSIGIQNNGLSSDAKSLFINGETETFKPTIYPTMLPITNTLTTDIPMTTVTTLSTTSNQRTPNPTNIPTINSLTSTLFPVIDSSNMNSSDNYLIYIIIGIGNLLCWIVVIVVIIKYIIYKKNKSNKQMINLDKNTDKDSFYKSNSGVQTNIVRCGELSISDAHLEMVDITQNMQNDAINNESRNESDITPIGVKDDEFVIKGDDETLI